MAGQLLGCAGMDSGSPCASRAELDEAIGAEEARLVELGRLTDDARQHLAELYKARSGARRAAMKPSAPPAERLGRRSAPEWTRTTTPFTQDKALNLVPTRHIRPPAFRSSVLAGIADASDTLDELTFAKDLSRAPLSRTPRRRDIEGLGGDGPDR